MTLTTQKTNWTVEKNVMLLDRYKELNLIPFSCSLSEDDKGKKKFTNLPQHATITKYDDKLIKTYNGLCIKTGVKIDDNNYLILVDIDNKNNTINKWYDLLKTHHKTKNLKTPQATTGNNGLHYLFKVSSDKFEKLQSSYTRICINGERLDIDIKGRNQMQLAEPSKYKSLDGVTKRYTWIDESIYKYNIMDLPKWIYDALLTPLPISNVTSEASGNQNKEYQKLTLDMFPDNKPKEEDLDYFNLFSFERLDNSSTWISVGFLCYCLYDNETGFIIWNQLSKISSKYDYNDILHTWKKSIVNKPKKMTKGSLIKFAEFDNKIECDKLKDKYMTTRASIRDFIDDDPFIDDNEVITINQRYLLDQDKKLNDNTVLCDTVKQFFKSDKSSLNIKSPYDTGKTQLMKEIINTYNPKRILWLSTRITYTFDMLKTFEEDYGFISYHDNNFKADRIVIQVESVFKLASVFSDVVLVYDLIVLDEIESILKQFNSEQTVKDKARVAFDYLH